LAELGGSLSALGPVTRYRNLDLWDALATAIVRQVIRAGQSKRLYRAFADGFGERADAGAGRSLALFPGPDRVLELSDDAFASYGMAFKRRPLRHAALAYQADGEGWQSLPARDLVETLQSVPGIGPWTASAAVADYTNDWTVYPHGDLAVRTWARRAAPGTPWPDNDADFASQWRRCAGPQLSALTVLVLAWGSRRGDIG
jgi:DNA-3-methyladenine glycosylase II